MKKHNKLVLSIFPSIDLLGKAFSQNGFCVVKGEDKLIDGGDIKNFRPPSGVFGGVIGGPPCQQFSRLNRNRDLAKGMEGINQYKRVVTVAQPDWFLCENVVGFPDFQIDGYTQQRFQLDLAWFSNFSRRREFIFGSKSGKLLNPIYKKNGHTQGTAVTGKDERSFRTCCDIQGLPKDFNLPLFNLQGKKQVIANGVPMQMGNYLAQLINFHIYQEQNRLLFDIPPVNRCPCGCRRQLTGRQTYASNACKQRMFIARKREKLQLN